MPARFNFEVEHFNTSLYKETRAKLNYRRSSKDQCLLHFTLFFCTQTITAKTFLKQTETLYINWYYKYEGKVRWWSWSIEHFQNGGPLKKQPIFLILRLVWEDYTLHLNFTISLLREHNMWVYSWPLAVLKNVFFNLSFDWGTVPFLLFEEDFGPTCF